MNATVNPGKNGCDRVNFSHSFRYLHKNNKLLESFWNEIRVGRCGAAPHALTLFKTNIADFPTLFGEGGWTEFRFLIPCLRHLTRRY